mmetsp:Transcript_28504/g.59938  ORF Transcript_28504/g.59938 Transcript_28504/m.59938 type:complete len:84 (+) Transcript_28504:223-474(+)|eukprot:CAMPEP_0171349102 /NCGR_PEP_ID=MMETSP0878-20121228/32776_1 /TAXON_ID=67004 /ORGANISM="Thalassiosira weissflogii, Strain CCMP1336" /LENGTH=83 /DNA_ID=CAMNT_0011853651 /DNA_START=218 /DNA_END=469 /DNA_ORIENTATION=-
MAAPKSDKSSMEEKPKKVMVPRKQLQSVPDLLANGSTEESESIFLKISWMVFLLIMFYLSLEVFLNIAKKRAEAERGSSNGEL